jgi:hypothetical protein
MCPCLEKQDTSRNCWAFFLWSCHITQASVQRSQTSRTPTIDRSSNIETSWRVTVHDPLGKLNVCDSGLHLSAKAVIKWQSIWHFRTSTTLPKPHCCNSGTNKSCGSLNRVIMRGLQGLLSYTCQHIKE